MAQLNSIDILFKAVAQGKFRLVYSILESGHDVNTRDSDMLTPVMRATYLSREDIRSHIVRLLLKYNADVNARDSCGRTVLMHACGEIGRLDVIRRVIATSKCDVNICDMEGNTALVYAILKDNPSAVRILMNSAFTKDKILVNIKNSIDETPLSLAVHFSLQECAKILVNEGGADTSTVDDQPALKKLLTSNGSPRRHSVSAKVHGRRTQLPSRAAMTDGLNSMASLRLEKISLHLKSSGITTSPKDSPDMICNFNYENTSYNTVAEEQPEEQLNAENPTDNLPKSALHSSSNEHAGLIRSVSMTHQLNTSRVVSPTTESQTGLMSRPTSKDLRQHRSTFHLPSPRSSRDVNLSVVPLALSPIHSKSDLCRKTADLEETELIPLANLSVALPPVSTPSHTPNRSRFSGGYSRFPSLFQRRSRNIEQLFK